MYCELDPGKQTARLAGAVVAVVVVEMWGCMIAVSGTCWGHEEGDSHDCSMLSRALRAGNGDDEEEEASEWRWAGF
jgi:hypothetical protein